MSTTGPLNNSNRQATLPRSRIHGPPVPATSHQPPAISHQQRQRQLTSSCQLTSTPAWINSCTAVALPIFATKCRRFARTPSTSAASMDRLAASFSAECSRSSACGWPPQSLESNNRRATDLLVLAIARYSRSHRRRPPEEKTLTPRRCRVRAWSQELSRGASGASRQGTHEGCAPFSLQRRGFIIERLFSDIPSNHQAPIPQ